MSSGESIKEKVIRVVNASFGCDDVSEDTHFIEDLSADSLDSLDLMMDVEDEFDVSFSDEEAEAFQTVGDLIRAVQAKLDGN